ncbi:MAG: histidine phosphatase family protein [Nitrospinota bacterium]|jgi:broad specificity phosphatase PhoE|nr:histidine phosphatase family protein [Nitrospinota bacterium]MDP6482608.1 histidine phosphatase family protein [Nitrospinota bacterium]MDP6618872.1 histidine phosphatase family protein [Nitrospinota bacterium]HJM42957.1 histidine phosphatase family protein [Nitrospinota bacterium]
MEWTPIDENTTRIFIIRHGEVENYDRGIFNGQIDVDITPRGVGHMERAAEFLAPAGERGGTGVRRLYSSDLLRTVRGAAIISERLGLNEKAEAVPGIREIHLGEWQGLSFEEVDDRFPGMRETRHADIVNYRIPGSETVAELSARVVPAVEEIAGRHRGESVAIVAHAGPNRMVLCHALGVPLKHIFHIQQDYGAINVLDFSAEGAVVRLMNG